MFATSLILEMNVATNKRQKMLGPSGIGYIKEVNILLPVGLVYNKGDILYGVRYNKGVDRLFPGRVI